MLGANWPERVLCPVDFSDLSAGALRVAGRIAAKAGARLEVVHAYAWEAPAYITQARMEEMAEQHRAAFAASGEALRAFVETQIPGVAAETVVVEGRAMDAIRKRVAGVDLVVMGTHGRSGMGRLLLGSVAEQALHESAIPILTVREEGVAAGFQKILVAMAVGERDRYPLEVAARLAEREGAALTVVTVTPEGVEAGEAGCAVVPESVRRSCDLRTIVRTGQPDAQILAVAEEMGADLLVIGGRHKPFRDVTVLGTTTVRVVRHAPMPVLTVFPER